MFSIKGPHYPAIFVHDGQTFIVSGHVWQKVPTGTTLAEVQYEAPATPKKQPTYQTVTRVVPSSKDPRITYTVRVRSDGLKDCGCSGFMYRRRCRHTDELKKELGWA